MRREFLFLFATVALIVSTPARAAETLSSEQPNISYLMADDMGWGDAGCYTACPANRRDSLKATL